MNSDETVEWHHSDEDKEPQQIHVYVLPYQEDLSPALIDQLLSVLSVEEQARYERMLSRQKRMEFLIARTLLRRILGITVDLPPQELCFELSEHGKPRFVPVSTVLPVPFFNLSHTDHCIVLAVTFSGEVGIDIETQAVYKDRVAQRFFHPQEYDWLCHLSPDLRDAAFYRIWTIKEACVKALGLGLQFPLREICTTPAQTGRCLDLYWQVLAISSTYHCAVACYIPESMFLPVIQITHLDQNWIANVC